MKLKIGSPEYQEKLWEFFSSQGGVPKDYGMVAAQGWYIDQENKFKAKCVRDGIGLEEADPEPKSVGSFQW